MTVALRDTRRDGPAATTNSRTATLISSNHTTAPNGLPAGSTDASIAAADALPAPIRDMAKAISRNLQVPLDMPVGMMLAVMSSATLGAYTTSPLPDWIEPLCQWIGTVASPGTMKSPCQKRVYGPMHAWEADRVEDDRTVVARSQAEHAQLEQDVRITLAVLKKAKKADTDNLARNWDSHSPWLNEENNHIRAVEALENHELLSAPRIFADDTTPEALARRLDGFPTNHITIESTEANVFGNFDARYTRTPQFEVLLKTYTADQITVDRVGGNPIIVRHPTTTLAIGVQPGVLEKLATDDLHNNGLISRFAFIRVPWNIGQQGKYEPIPSNVTAAYAEALRAKADQAWKDVHEKTLEERVIPFTDLASHALEHTVRPAREARMAELGEDDPMTAWHNKHDGRVARIAALIAIFEDSTEVGPGHLQRAASIGDFLAMHAEATYDLIAPGPANRTIEKIRRKVERTGQTVWTDAQLKKALHVGERKYKTTHADYDEAITILVNNDVADVAAKSTWRFDFSKWPKEGK